MYVHGAGAFHPDNVITNAFLESLDIGTTDEWITSRVGIRERRTSLPLDYIRTTKNQNIQACLEASPLSHLDFVERASRAALAKAGVTPDQIGMVIADPGGQFYRTPAVANLVADRLGIQGGLCFDVGTACATFGLQVHLLNQMKPEALPDFILVALGSPISWITNYADRNTCVLFGDASAAVVISPRVPGGMELLASVAGSDSSQWKKIQAPVYSHFLFDGAGVQKFAISKAVATAKAVLPPGEAFGKRVFIGHPANMAMLDLTVRMLEGDPSRHLHDIARYGNTGQSSAPAVLAEHWDDVQPGEEVVMSVVGGGLTWAGLRLRKL